MTELLTPNRQQVFYANAVAITAANTYPQALGGAATAYVVHSAAGQAHLLGLLTCTTAPAAGFPRIRFYAQSGNAAALTAIYTYAIPAASGSTTVFPVDVPLYTPWFTIEWTQGAADGVLTGSVWALPAGAGGGGGGSSDSGEPILAALGYEQLTVAGASIGLASIPGTAQFALITIETAAIRYRDDGVAPTAAVGMPMVAQQSLFYNGGQSGLSALRFIRQTATSATLNALYYSN